MMSVQQPEDVLDAYLLGELTPEQERSLDALSASWEAPADPSALSWQEELALARRLRAGLKAQERQSVLPHSVVIPEDLEPEPLPAALQARLLAIVPKTSAALTPEPPRVLRLPTELELRLQPEQRVPPHAADVASSPHPLTQRPALPDDTPSFLERWLFQPLRQLTAQLQELEQSLRWSLSAGVALALLLVVALPLLRAPEPETVFKGGPTLPAQLRPQASLNLVARDQADGPVYRLPLEELSPGVWGARIRRNQTLQPVVLSRDVDLAARVRYGWVLGITAEGQLLSLGAPLQGPLQRLPQTDHLYALPLPLELQEVPTRPLRLRLHVLLTETPVALETLQKLASTRDAASLSRPTLLLDALPEVQGLEATLLLELP